MKLIRPNAWIRSYYKDLIWQLDTKEKALALTFDDGPDPIVTDYVLKALEEYKIKATFFVVGENAKKYPELMQRLREEGHQIGNHTHNHLKGWKTSLNHYTENIIEAEKFTSSRLFRPPYGKITKSQAKWLLRQNYKVTMWSILTYDFDVSIDVEDMIQKIKKKTRQGSIVTFHDSQKAFPQLKEMLPNLIESWVEEGYTFQTI